MICGPLAGGGVQVGVDGPRLNIVDRNAARPQLTRQPLREHLDGPFGRRVGGHAGHEHALPHARTDHDDSPAGLQVLERRLRRDEDAADVDRKDAIEVSESRLLDLHRNDRAGVVHQYVEPAKGRDRPFDGVADGIGVGSVCLDRERLSASAFNLFDNGRRRVSAFGEGDGDAGAVLGQALGDRGADAARTARDERDLACQWSFLCTA